MLIFQDYTCGGQWHYCEACQQSGDIIQLAARVWKLSVPAAIVKLASLGVEFPAEALQPPIIQRYVEEQIDYLARMTRMWQRSSGADRQYSKGVQDLVHEFGWRCNVTNDRYLAGPAQLFGALDYKSIEETYAPIASTTARNAVKTSSQGRVFRGRGWSDVVVIPFYDLPQRLRGYLFAGREGKAADWTFKKFNLQQNNTEVGLAFHPQVIQASQDWGHTVFGFSDAELAIRLQSKHFQIATRPLPIVIWRDDQAGYTQKAWRIFANRAIVLWSAEVDWKLIRQAKLSEAYISLAGPEEQDRTRIHEWSRKMPGTELLRIVQKAAKPWPEALSRWILGAAPEAVEELFLRLKLAGELPAKIVERLSHEAQERARSITTEANAVRSVQIESFAVTEQAEGWLARSGAKREELVSDTVLRVDQVIHNSLADQTYYRGRLIRSGKEFAFCDRRENIEPRPFRWMQDQLIRHGQGLLKFAPKWERRLLTIAAQFHEAEFVRGIELVGWDATRDSFVLPGYTMQHNGLVVDTEHIVLDEMELPAKHLPKPELLTPIEIERLTSAGSDGLWSIVAAVAYNILAPAVGSPQLGIAAVEHPAARVVANLLGCSIKEETSRAKSFQTSPHGWPTWLVAQKGFPQALLNSLLTIDQQPNCGIDLAEDKATVALLNGNWMLVRGADTPEDMSLVPRILPSFLQYFCQQGMRLPVHQDPVAAVREVIRDWLKTLKSFEGISGLPSLISPFDAKATCEQLGQLLAGAVLRRFITVLPKNFESDPAEEILYCDETDTAQFGKGNLDYICQKLNLPRIDPARVTAMLSQAGLLREESGQWWVPKPWFDQQLHRWRSRNSKLLKLHKEA